MSYQEILAELKTLSVSEQLSLIQKLVELVKDDLVVSDKKDEVITANDRASAIERLRGVIKPEGPMLTDEDADRLRLEYLQEKYK